MISSFLTQQLLALQRPSVVGRLHLGLGRRHARCRYPGRRVHIASKPLEEVEPVPPILLPEIENEELMQIEGRWVSDMVRCWLDEEWTPLEVHRDLGEAAGQAYMKLRQQGQTDVSDLVLGLSSELLTFNYRETFVNAFEVSNKVVELLMLRAGCEVCCTSPQDRSAIQRYEQQLREERAGQPQ